MFQTTASNFHERLDTMNPSQKNYLDVRTFPSTLHTITSSEIGTGGTSFRALHLANRGCPRLARNLNPEQRRTL